MKIRGIRQRLEPAETMNESIDQARAQKKKQIWFSAALIAILTLLSFSSALTNGFITTWDDRIYVTENPLIGELSWKNLTATFSGFYANFYHPLVILSYAVEHALFGMNPAAFHATNVMLHVLNALLVFWLIHLLSDRISLSLVAALLFGVHPLHVESVAWIAERKDVLSTFFFLFAAVLYLIYKQKKRRAHYCLSILMFLAALLSKPMAVTLPLVLILCDYLESGSFDWGGIRDKAPFFILSLLFGILHLFAHFDPGTAAAGTGSVPFEPFKNLLLACWGIVFYLFKAIWPVRLSALYPYPETVSIASPVYFLPPLLLPVLAAGVYISRNYTRGIVFGSLFFLVTLLPVLRLLPFHGDIIAADRYMYIPSIGLFYIAGLVYYWAAHREGRRAKAVRSFTVALTLFVILVLALLTFQRNKVWRDDETLWRDTARKSPESHRAHNNLGFIYARQGRLEESADAFLTALDINPAYFNARMNLGLSYAAMRRWDEAIAAYQKALRMKPDHDGLQNRLGIAYAEKGQFPQAMAAFQKALEINPRAVEARSNLGNIYMTRKRYDLAVQAYRAALAIDPGFEPARRNLQRALQMSRQPGR
jgi:hypothetical protein